MLDVHQWLKKRDGIWFSLKKKLKFEFKFQKVLEQSEICVLAHHSTTTTKTTWILKSWQYFHQKKNRLRRLNIVHSKFVSLSLFTHTHNLNEERLEIFFLSLLLLLFNENIYNNRIQMFTMCLFNYYNFLLFLLLFAMIIIIIIIIEIHGWLVVVLLYYNHQYLPIIYSNNNSNFVIESVRNLTQILEWWWWWFSNVLEKNDPIKGSNKVHRLSKRRFVLLWTIKSNQNWINFF